MCWKDKQVVRKPGKGTMRKSNGVPDILGILKDGTFLGIEVKKPGQKLEPHQQEFQERALLNGAMCFRADCVEDVIKRFP